MSTGVAAKKKRRVLPYWLFGNEEVCAGCERTHAAAVEARCVACDRVQCLVCAIHVGGEVFCSECHQNEGGRKRWPRGRSGKVS
jgi:hypothetical protein